jgi:hypothetical protein
MSSMKNTSCTHVFGETGMGVLLSRSSKTLGSFWGSKRVTLEFAPVTLAFDVVNLQRAWHIIICTHTHMKTCYELFITI